MSSHHLSLLRCIPRFDALIAGPAVLALFAWFVFAACSDPREVNAEWSAMQSSTKQNGAEAQTFYANTGYALCTPPGADSKQDYEREADEYKRSIEQAENANKRCGGPRSDDAFKKQFGCDDAKIATLKGQIQRGQQRVDRLNKEFTTKWPTKREPTSTTREGPAGSYTVINRNPAFYNDAPAAENEALMNDINEVDRHLKPLKDELKREEAKCSRARDAAEKDGCTQASFDSRNSIIDFNRQQLAAVNRKLKEMKRCEDETKRAQTPARPAIDPSTVLQGLGGLGARQRPTSRPSQPAPAPSGGHKD